MFTIPVNTFLESPTGDLKIVNISMRVSLLEKQNWHYGNHLKEIPVMLLTERVNRLRL